MTNENNTIVASFFLPILPPTTTHQTKRVNWQAKKFYDSDEVKALRKKFEAYTSQFKPEAPVDGPVQLVTKWLYPITKGRANGQYKTTRPDTDNMIKLLKDCMTRVGFWNDDAQVASEITEKFWAEQPGIFIEVRRLEEHHETI